MATQAELIARIEAIKVDLVALDDLRPGTISAQYNVCGNPNCACKADPPAKHGPYYQLSYTRNRRSHTEAVRPEHLDSVRSQIANYQRLQALLDDWVAASIDLDRLRRAPDQPSTPAKGQGHTRSPQTPPRRSRANPRPTPKAQ